MTINGMTVVEEFSADGAEAGTAAVGAGALVETGAAAAAGVVLVFAGAGTLVDKMIVFFQFEKVFYRKFGLEVSFVGHPLIDHVQITKSKEQALGEIGWDTKRLTIGILPGSREKEVERMKEDFTSMIVHELRSPLDGIKKIVESIRKSKMKKRRCRRSSKTHGEISGCPAAAIFIATSGRQPRGS